MAIIKAVCGTVITIDENKLEALNMYNWSISNKGYAVASSFKDKKEKPKYYPLMHRLLTNCPKGMTVDHVNGNRLDNRLENLEIVTQSENSKRVHRNGRIDYKNRKRKSKEPVKQVTFVNEWPI